MTISSNSSIPCVLCQFVVSPHGSQEVLGLVVAYNADFRHRFCHAAAAIHPRLHRRGLGIEAFMGLARYVYYGWDFRMIIMETVGRRIPELLVGRSGRATSRSKGGSVISSITAGATGTASR